MRRQIRVWIVGAALVGSVVYLATQQIRAADDDQDVKGAVEKIAKNLAAHNDSAAQAIANKLPDDLDAGDVMGLLDKRHANGKGGLGIGGKPDTGIEKMIQEFAKTAPTRSKLNRDGQNLKHAAYIMAAAAEAVHNRPPVKAPTGKKNPEDWKKWSAQMKTQSLQFAKALESNDPAAVHKAADTLNNTCIQCHDIFKD